MLVFVSPKRGVLQLLCSLVIFLIAPSIAHAHFTDIGAGLPGAFFADVAWGDYDNDGDLDLILTGDNSGPDPITQIWRNDAGVFTDIMASLTAIKKGSAVWGDYDNDGDLDILLTGRGDLGRVSEVWRNDGSDTFTDIMAGLTTVENASAAWGDYDNDGDLDILLSGNDPTTNKVSQIWRNDGGGTFTNILAGLTGVSFGSVAWGDYDEDGDLDILLTGEEAGRVSVSQIWRNDAGVFTDIMAGLTGVDRGSAAWGDYDNDGDLDVLLTGITADFVPVSEVWRNDGGVFTDIVAGLSHAFDSGVAWGDYDNDGDLDILLTGGNLDSDQIAQVWRNDGGAFTDIMGGLTGVAASSAAWGDYDNDGDFDVILAGNVGPALNPVTQIWRNDLPPVTDLSFTDNMAGFVGVGDSSVAWADYDKDGDLDVLVTGRDSGSVPFSEVYNNNGGAFAPIGAGLADVADSGVAWGDYDDDGDLDILLSGLDVGSDPFTEIYNNDGGVFTAISAGLTAVVSSAVAWGDYDNDGDLDILLTGMDAGGNPFADVYNNDGGAFMAIGAGLVGVDFSGVAWGDYDNDGDLDILLTGNDVGGNPFADVYNNDSGVFMAIGAGLTAVAGSSVAWGDYDNDGDLDILLSGLAGGVTFFSDIYNNDDGIFTAISAGLAGVGGASVSWGDYDNDGDLDVLVTGFTGFSQITVIYNNNGGAFSAIGAGLNGVGFSSAAWGDYDNDGDMDILLSGRVAPSSPVTEVWRNDSCALALSTSSNTIAAVGAIGETIDISSTLASCGWTAVSNDAWITITGGASGTGDGTVTYDVDPLMGVEREGTITIGDHTFRVVQDMCVAPAVTLHPSDEFVCEGTTRFTVRASGSPEPRIQWQVDSGGGFVDIRGETGLTLTVFDTMGALNGNMYRAVFTNHCGSVTTTPAPLTSIPLSIDPSNSVPAQGATGQIVNITVGSTCSWLAVSDDSFITIIGTRGSTGNGMIEYSVAPNPGTARQGTISINGLVHTVTQAACSAPIVTMHPSNDSACGGSPTFTASASSASSASVQWQVSTGGAFANIPGATSPSLVLSNVSADMEGNQYRAVFTNACGTATTTAATLLSAGTPMMPPEFITATSGDFADLVRVRWSPVDGATGYRVFRAESEDLSDAVDLSGIITQLIYIDRTAGLSGGMGCHKSKAIKYYYFVVPVNGCGDGPASHSDEGYLAHSKHAGLNTTNVGDFGLLVLTLAWIFAYQRRRRLGLNRKPVKMCDV